MISFNFLPSLSALISIALSLDVTSNDSLSILASKVPLDSSKNRTPNNQHAASLNTSLTPAKSPQFAHNMSKLVELGLDVNRSISWTTSASGNAIGVRMYILEFSFPFYVIFRLHDHVPRAH